MQDLQLSRESMKRYLEGFVQIFVEGIPALGLPLKGSCFAEELFGFLLYDLLVGM